MTTDDPDHPSLATHHRSRRSSSPGHRYHTSRRPSQLLHPQDVMQRYPYAAEPEEPYHEPSSYGAAAAMNAAPHGALHQQDIYGQDGSYQQSWSHAESSGPYPNPWEYHYPVQQQQQQLSQSLYQQVSQFYPQPIQNHWSIGGQTSSIPPVSDRMGHYVEPRLGRSGDYYHPGKLAHSFHPADTGSVDDQSHSISTAGGSDGAQQPPAKRQRKPKPRFGKRFVWSDDIHGEFVRAIFETGLKSAFAEQITMVIQSSGEAESLSLDTVALLLERYRAKHHGIRDAFLVSHLARIAKQASAVADSVPELAPSLSTSSRPAADDRNGTGSDSVCWLTLPELTEAERASPLGTALTSLTDTLRTLERRLMEERTAAKRVAVVHDNSAGADHSPPPPVDTQGASGSTSSAPTLPGRRPLSRERSSLSLVDLQGLGDSFDREADEHMIRFLSGL